MNFKSRMLKFDQEIITKDRMEEIPEVPISSTHPKKMDDEQKWKHLIHEKLMEVIDFSSIGVLDDEQTRDQIQHEIYRVMDTESVPLTASARQRIAKQIEDEILGLGPLEPLMSDTSIADILVHRYDSICVERYGKIEDTDVRFKDEEHLRNIIDRIVSAVGRRIDEASPMVDARLKDGSRVNVVIPPIALDGAILSIRRFAVDRLQITDLERLGAITPEVSKLIEGIVKARLNVLISGGTGSGKTTMLNVCSGFIPNHEVVVTIEDSAELQLQHPHVRRLETRPPNIEGKGEIPPRELVRNSLRMRPDRIIVGEVRTGEAFDMLQAMNSGHDGSLTTIHANSPRDSLTRLENMVTMTGFPLPSETIRQQISSAIDIVIQLERMEDGRRRMTSLQEIQGMEGHVITMSEIFSFQRQGVDEEGNIIGRLRPTGLIPHFAERMHQRGISIDFSSFDMEK